MNDVRINAVERIAPTLAATEDKLREDLLERLVLSNLVYLRRGNSVQFGQNGWFAAQSTVELPAENDLARFPVPTECRTWHSHEFDDRTGLVFRFFVKRAWFYLPAPKHRCRLELIVPFAVVPEALNALQAWVGDVRVALMRDDADRFGRTRFLAEISPPLFAYMQMAERVRIDLECAITGVPALLYRGSNDQRRLFCAISRPRFVEI